MSTVFRLLPAAVALTELENQMKDGTRDIIAVGVGNRADVNTLPRPKPSVFGRSRLQRPVPVYLDEDIRPGWMKLYGKKEETDG